MQRQSKFEFWYIKKSCEPTVDHSFLERKSLKWETWAGSVKEIKTFFMGGVATKEQYTDAAEEMKMRLRLCQEKERRQKKKN